MDIPLAKPIFTDEMRDAAIRTLKNEWYVLGESVFKFEEEFAHYCNAKRAVSTSSGTNALQLALLSLKLDKNNEVITTPASFIATANAILHSNLAPEFSDINLNTYNLDPNKVKNKITKKTKAIMPVYLYGRPANIDEFNNIAEENNVSIIADAAQAHGALYKNKKVGSEVDLSCFSFYSSKCMTVCGDGGMITTNDDEKADYIEKLRDCGRTSKYEHDVIGYTSRLNTVNASIGRVQLKYLDKWNKKRRAAVTKYRKKLSHIEEVILPPNDDDIYISSYYLFVIRINDRDNLKEHLNHKGINTGIHYPIPIHLQPIYKSIYKYKENTYPNSELLSNTALSIPLFPEITNDEINYICEHISEYYNK